MLQSEILGVINHVASSSTSRDEPTMEPQPPDAPAAPEAEDGQDDNSDELPANVPDDWLDPKPFDPAGR